MFLNTSVKEHILAETKFSIAKISRTSRCFNYKYSMPHDLLCRKDGPLHSNGIQGTSQERVSLTNLYSCLTFVVQWKLNSHESKSARFGALQSTILASVSTHVTGYKWYGNVEGRIVQKQLLSPCTICNKIWLQELEFLQLLVLRFYSRNRAVEYWMDLNGSLPNVRHLKFCKTVRHQLLLAIYSTPVCLFGWYSGIDEYAGYHTPIRVQVVSTVAEEYWSLPVLEYRFIYTTSPFPNWW